MVKTNKLWHFSSALTTIAFRVHGPSQKLFVKSAYLDSIPIPSESDSPSPPGLQKATFRNWSGSCLRGFLFHSFPFISIDAVKKITGSGQVLAGFQHMDPCQPHAWKTCSNDDNDHIYKQCSYLSQFPWCVFRVFDWFPLNIEIETVSMYFIVRIFIYPIQDSFSSHSLYDINSRVASTGISLHGLTCHQQYQYNY